ncbi:hypothetical protein DB41_FN00010 [Neochlamydia sp. TUME1]|nr:hypothetical protein DB41_FN00010 [Neochlamydia sp. TUME1]
MANDPLVQKKVVYQDIAFSNKKWAICFGKKENERRRSYRRIFFLYPHDTFKILKNPCLAFPGKRVIDTHMLVRIPRTLVSNFLP